MAETRHSLKVQDINNRRCRNANKDYTAQESPVGRRFDDRTPTRLFRTWEYSRFLRRTRLIDSRRKWNALSKLKWKWRAPKNSSAVVPTTEHGQHLQDLNMLVISKLSKSRDLSKHKRRRRGPKKSSIVALTTENEQELRDFKRNKTRDTRQIQERWMKDVMGTWTSMKRTEELVDRHSDGASSEMTKTCKMSKTQDNLKTQD